MMDGLGVAYTMRAMNWLWRSLNARATPDPGI